MIIHIENFRFETIIGILDFEREEPQIVEINLTLEYEFNQNQFIDYVKIRDLIQSNMNENKYFLIEDALIQIAQQIKKNFSSSQRLNLKITKPNILENAQVSVSEKFEF